MFQADAFVPSLQEYTLDVAPALGMASLRDIALPEGDREIRIWIGFGIEQPDVMLRLRVAKDGGVRSETISWFEMHGSTDYDQEVLANMGAACAHVSRHRAIAACVIGETPIDASALYSRLQAAGIWTLPDESRLPKSDHLVVDGTAMVVELRDGSRYRAYEYSNPQFRNQPETAAATRIMEEVDAAVHGKVRSSNH